MAFWGAEVKPGEPFIHEYNPELGRLRLSQATLGSGSSKKKTILECTIGDKSPIYLCSLLPEKLETCPLTLEFEEDYDVKFSVIGKQSVYLSGFYLAVDVSDSSDYSLSDSSDSEAEDEDNLIAEEDLALYPELPSPKPNSGVKIEEIVEDEKALKSEEKEKKKKKKKNKDENSESEVVITASDLETEDEDGFPVRTNGVSSEEKKEEPTKNFKRKIDSVIQEEDDENTKKSSEESDAVIENNEEVAEKEGKKKKKKNKKKKAKIEEEEEKEKEEEKAEEEEEKKEENGGGSSGKKVRKIRTFSNGMIVEEVVMGRPVGKEASNGKKVSVRYIGKLKSNGKIFDSNINKAPFSFRLGIGEVIAGWDVGVKGMRVGDKRRLTIPPAMGYGAKGAKPAIPPNAWLVFDVELLAVN